MKRVLVVCPQERDRAAVRSAGVHRRYDVRFAGPDLDAAEVDAVSLLEELAREPADGVVGTKDRSALVASLLAERKQLPGPSPAAVIRCQHKLTSRGIQRRVAPEATPDFAALDGAPPFPPPPFFAKPVVGRLSRLARRIEHVAEIADLDGDDAYERDWAELAALAAFPAHAARGYLAEELLEGDEVTLEGFVERGRVTVVGITDSVKYPGSNSFERFEYPTQLDGERRAELREVAARLLPALGFDGGLFNVEFVVPASGPAQILEVNGRIASQFAPLVQAVHGRSTYEALFALACGEASEWAAEEPAGVALSYVMRVFEDAWVAGVPDAEEGLEILVRPGARLSQQGANDTASFRLAIFFEAGETREEALQRARERARDLRRRFDLRPLPTASPPRPRPGRS